MQKIIFIESQKSIKNFYFLTFLNSVFEINPLFEFIYKEFKPLLVARRKLLFKLKNRGYSISDEILLKENTYIFDALFIPFSVPSVKTETLFVNKGKIVGILLKKGKLKAPFDFEKYKNFDAKEIEGIYIESFYNLPDLIGNFVEYILRTQKVYKKLKKGLYLKRGRVKKGIYIDTSDGPVIIEELKKINPPVTLVGPLYIGKDVHLFRSFIKKSFLKDILRLGGEIDSSVFFGYSNKAHEGYIGHSIIGKWVNLGALTTTSDLKNTYSEIKAYVGNRKINTGKIKFGVLICDHVQTGIGTLLSSGTVVSSFCNLYGGIFFSKFIEPFTWWGPEGKKIYKLEKAIEVAKKMMKRRNIKMDEDYKKLIVEYYNEVRG